MLKGKKTNREENEMCRMSGVSCDDEKCNEVSINLIAPSAAFI